MIIGVPKEIKKFENRVGMTPACVEALVNKGHSVYIEKLAGCGSGFYDADYIGVGAKILDSAEEVLKVPSKTMRLYLKG